MQGPLPTKRPDCKPARLAACPNRRLTLPALRPAAPQYTVNFLNLLIDQNRIEALDEICESFEKSYCALTDTQVGAGGAGGWGLAGRHWGGCWLGSVQWVLAVGHCVQCLGHCVQCCAVQCGGRLQCCSPLRGSLAGLGRRAASRAAAASKDASCGMQISAADSSSWAAAARQQAGNMAVSWRWRL